MNGSSLIRHSRRGLSANVRRTSDRNFSISGQGLKQTTPRLGNIRINGPHHEVRKKKSISILAVTASASGLAAALYYKDDLTHAFKASVRTGRVLKTMVLCMNDYRITLKQNEKIEDKEERNRSMTACHQRCADRTLKTLEDNAGIFIKLGQHLSAMGYLLPIPWTTTFIPLQDKCPVSSYESLETMFKMDTGQEITEYFSSFSFEPIGAASLAQVHLATIRENARPVAVKVQHPALAEWAMLDLELIKFTFSTVKKFFPNYDFDWLSREIEYSLPLELDFTKEGQNALRCKEYFSKFPKLPLVIPDVIWAKRRILVMENVSGHRPDDLEYLDKNGIDRDEVSAALARIFNQMIFGKGAPLHCDPHGGNIAIRKNEKRRECNFDIILYDHGLYRDIPNETRRSYAKLWLSFIDSDEPKMRQYAREVAGVTDDKFIIFASAITGREFSVVTSDISKKRSAEEKMHLSKALSDGMLQDLIELLSQVPRIILLILKTNDLTRSLDENLHTRHGPVRTFLILARYCSRTVLEEKLEELYNKKGLLWPSNMFSLFRCWWDFLRVQVKLEVFELGLVVQRNWQDYTKFGNI
ncbi:ABC1 family protein MCP2-like protein [Erysiphe neolycopersici]|uniref:ABC1 family protein MCP2-like protein n=1 Tax=Erysiphe neolycopersici TaxID=212602 RepID=A0A420HV11_9PEZI|nr:ABC1 family protein MCP2-like protein [Erysiphe neolycopersici]